MRENDIFGDVLRLRRQYDYNASAEASKEHFNVLYLAQT